MYGNAMLMVASMLLEARFSAVEELGETLAKVQALVLVCDKLACWNRKDSLQQFW